MEAEERCPLVELLTIADVAQLTRSTVAAVYQWRRRGIGPKGLHVGGKILFRPQDIEEWLESRAEPRRVGLDQVGVTGRIAGIEPRARKRRAE